MQRAASDVARTRATIYYALAEALAEPVPGVYDTLLAAAMAGTQILDSEASRAAALALSVLPPDNEQTWHARYRRAFLPPGRRPLALYESLHREGCLMGEATLAVERSYRSLGLEPNMGELPDHASVELAFLGGLTAAEAQAHTVRDLHLVARLRKEQRRFLHEHVAAWLPSLGAELVASGVAPYAAVGSWLDGFVREETASKRRQRRRARIPVLVSPTDCTLCGLCTGRCKTGALRIVEDAALTQLTLFATRCIGCDLCAAICPESVLVMADGSPSEQGDGTDDGSQPVSGWRLRSSTRLACPRCGQPTVSEAEMDGICARLQLDEQMQRRMRLCVACKSVM